MDRESADREPADLAIIELPRANAPGGTTVVSVCITCKTADGGGTVVGPDMFVSVRRAFGESDQNVQVRPVQCLSVCKRPATIAVSSSNGYTFLFGDLQPESGAAALVSFVKS